MQRLSGKVKVKVFHFLFVIFVTKYFSGFCFVDILINGFPDSKNIVFDATCILLFCNYSFIMYFALFLPFVVNIL